MAGNWKQQQTVQIVSKPQTTNPTFRFTGFTDPESTQKRPPQKKRFVGKTIVGETIQRITRQPRNAKNAVQSDVKEEKDASLMMQNVLHVAKLGILKERRYARKLANQNLVHEEWWRVPQKKKHAAQPPITHQVKKIHRTTAMVARLAELN